MILIVAIITSVILSKLYSIFYFQSLPTGMLSLLNITLLIILLIRLILSNKFPRSNTSPQDFTNLNTILSSLYQGILVVSIDQHICYINTYLHSILESSSISSAQVSLQSITSKSSEFIHSEKSLWSIITDALVQETDHDMKLGIIEHRNHSYQAHGKIIHWDFKPALLVSLTPIQNSCKDFKELYRESALKFVAHELRTPTIAISSYSETILKRYQQYLPEDASEMIRMINVSSHLLDHLVNDLLDCSMIMSNKFSVNKREFNLRKYMEKVLSLIQIQSQKRGIMTELDVDSDVPIRISSDPHRLSQIVLNLLNNALK